MADREKERKKIQKFEYLGNEKSFLDEIKNIFHSFWRAIIQWKIKKMIKNIADTSFKRKGYSMTSNLFTDTITQTKYLTFKC